MLDSVLSAYLGIKSSCKQGQRYNDCHQHGPGGSHVPTYADGANLSYLVSLHGSNRKIRILSTGHEISDSLESS